MSRNRDADELIKEIDQEADGAEVQEAGPYRATNDGLVWVRSESKEGEARTTALTNFVARIRAEVLEDDGAEQRRLFGMKATLKGRNHSFEVGAGSFSSLGWVTEHLGAEAIVWPGNTVRDHAKVAIQLLSGTVRRSVVFTHSGWRKVGDQVVYLHAAGAVGPNGPVTDIETHLEGALAGYALPDPPVGRSLQEAIRASLRLLDLGPKQVTVPVLAAVYRAPLCSADFSLFVAGPTHAGKSELSALAVQHYGASMNSRNLPGAWASTANSLEAAAFQAKDALFVVDDFAPTGAPADVQRLHREADRLLRAQGNRSARQRMRPDTTLRPPKPPRGLILSTGEDIPQGQSLRGRLLVLELGPDDIDWAALTGVQDLAASGVLAQAMSGYIKWLASKHDGLEDRVRARMRELRQLAVQSSAHRRTPEIVAGLGVGFEHLLCFAEEVGAIDPAERADLWESAWTHLGRAGEAQAEHMRAAEPTGRFLTLLRSAIVSGEAHLAGPNGAEPNSPEVWGWRLQSSTNGQFMTEERWDPRGSRVGWVEDDDVWLDPDASYKVAQKAGQGGEQLVVGVRTLQRRLHERGLLLSTDGRGRYPVRRVLQGARRTVLHISRVSLVEETALAAQTAHPGVEKPAPKFEVRG